MLLPDDQRERGCARCWRGAASDHTGALAYNVRAGALEVRGPAPQALACTLGRACSLVLSGTAKPRNPRHFDGIGGGRKRVSYVFMDKRNVSCT